MATCRSMFESPLSPGHNFFSHGRLELQTGHGAPASTSCAMIQIDQVD